MNETLFISHGSPALVLSEHPARDFLIALGRRLPPPHGALVVSAHFETPGIVLGAAPQPDTLHDFHGFPEVLYRLRYPAPGLPEHASRLAGSLRESGFEALIDPRRPLDHGVWSPLSLIWPQAQVPLLPVSVPIRLSTERQLDYGRLLGEFAEREGLWLIGSGAATHNLGDRKPESQPPDRWAREFHDWARGVAERGDSEALADWQFAPHARHAHPTPEHFLPLLVVLGAQNGRPMSTLHESFSFGNLSMLMLAGGALAERWHCAA